MNSKYMDNLFFGSSSVEEALKKYNDVKTLFKRAGMNIREFQSNSAEFIRLLPECDRDPATNPKLLGIKWIVDDDKIKITIPKFEIPVNPKKRDVLSSLASIFDPLGLVEPLRVKGKLFFQKIWMRKQQQTVSEPLPPEPTGEIRGRKLKGSKEWTVVLLESEKSEWRSILEDWESCPDFIIPRFIGNTVEKQCELHCFCDALALAFGCALYLMQNGQSHLIFAKSRIRPLKKGAFDDRLTIPKLELLSVVMGTRALKFILKEMRFNSLLQKRQVFLWSDSEIVLHWLKNPADKDPFVQRRLEEIRSLEGLLALHVPSADNPADDLSRGLTAKELRAQQRWWHGPPWLPSMAKWPRTDLLDISVLAQQKREEPEIFHQIVCPVIDRAPLIDSTQFISWSTLVFSTAHVFRFLARFSRKYTSKRLKSIKKIFAPSGIFQPDFIRP